MIGIIQDPSGHPVKQDPLGTPSEVKTGPYLLDDGVSLEAPIPVIIVTDDFYRDSSGNLRGVWPMNISNPTPAPEGMVVVDGETVVHNEEIVVHTE